MLRPKIKDNFANFALKNNNKVKKISKNRYIQGFCLVVVFLAIIRLIWPGVAEPSSIEDDVDTLIVKGDSVKEVKVVKRDVYGGESLVAYEGVMNATLDSAEVFRKHKIYSVNSFEKAFPDSNYVHMEQSLLWGVGPLTKQEDLTKYKNELVFIGNNPYYMVDSLVNSSPYLVPRAAILLQDIGRNFYDSLQVKGIPLHQIIVSSVLRSKEDVANLSTINGNASQNSCHQYATTFDISYNRYNTVQAPDGPQRRQVGNDSLKWVLSEVLDDLRRADRCCVKYEKLQPCFHVTVK